MSTIPFLPIWSSIKIPPLGYCGRCRNKIKLREDSLKQRYPQVVNLSVPIPITNKKENSFSDTCVYQDVKKKRVSWKKVKDINRLCVPISEISTPNSESLQKRGIENFDEMRHDFDENFPYLDNGNELCSIPSVKPWTSEELLELKKRYHSVEKKAEMKEREKRKAKAKKKIEQTVSLASDKPYVLHYQKPRKLPRNKSYDLDVREPQDFISPSTPNGSNYYGPTLAELYFIQLGIKR